MWEGEDYDLPEEEYNCHAREVGPCRKDFVVLGQTKRTYDSNTIMVRTEWSATLSGTGEFRKYERGIT